MHINRIPVSISLDNNFQLDGENKMAGKLQPPTLIPGRTCHRDSRPHRRIARFLVSLIDFFTNMFFYHRLSLCMVPLRAIISGKASLSSR